MDRYIETLKEKVEERLGKQPRVHGDFVYLADIIHAERHELISPTTLKRMWGYLKQETPTPQTRTLNILSDMLGFKDYKDFCHWKEMNIIGDL